VVEGTEFRETTVCYTTAYYPPFHIRPLPTLRESIERLEAAGFRLVPAIEKWIKKQKPQMRQRVGDCEHAYSIGEPSIPTTELLRQLLTRRVDAFADNYRSGFYLVLVDEADLRFIGELRLDGRPKKLPGIPCKLTILAQVSPTRLSITLVLRVVLPLKRDELVSLTHPVDLNVEVHDFRNVVNDLIASVAYKEVKIVASMTHSVRLLPTITSAAFNALESRLLQLENVMDLDWSYESFSDQFRTTTFTTVFTRVPDLTAALPDLPAVITGQSNYESPIWRKLINDANVSDTNLRKVLLEFNKYVCVSQDVADSYTWTAWGVLAGEVVSEFNFSDGLFALVLDRESVDEGDLKPEQTLGDIVTTISKIQNINFVQNRFMRRVLRRLGALANIDRVIESARNNLYTEMERRNRQVQRQQLGGILKAQEALVDLTELHQQLLDDSARSARAITVLTLVLVVVSVGGFLAMNFHSLTTFAMANLGASQSNAALYGASLVITLTAALDVFVFLFVQYWSSRSKGTAAQGGAQTTSPPPSVGRS
jgi:hypothetical protein